VNSTLTPIAPTESQVKFMNDLLTRLAEFASAEAVEALRQSYRDMYTTRALTKERASQEIENLLELVRIGREHAAKMGQQVPAQKAMADGPIALVPAGRYAITGTEGQTVFVHVVKFDSGAFIVNQQISDDVTRMPRGVARGVLQKIVDAGIEESSTRYGRELGVCGVCGRTLTNEDSRAAGIGPVCRSRLG
jgi:Family of unknown function (DUF6011)